MDATKRRALAGLLLGLVPPDGTPIGNQKLREQFLESAQTKGHKLSDADFESLHKSLIEDGTLARGKGRSGSVRRVKPADVSAFSLTQKIAPEPEEPKKAGKAKTGKRGNSAKDGEPQVLSYRHAAKRKNNPQVGLVNETTDPPAPKTIWKYDPHIDPALSFDLGRTGIEKIIDDALASGDEKEMRVALQQLKRSSSAYLNWAGKAERTSFKIDTVSLHVHERIDPMSVLAAVSKQFKDGKTGKRGGIQPGLFEAPFESLPLREAVDFYRHDRGWSNRLIAGDSLLVMNSLLQKESLAGQVQMIYIDPPYGIKYGSNFQPFTNKREVKDRKDKDLTQEPEMIKAFRDTWELDIHSYLTYLRDRLLLATDLLHESGSIFVQISDENLHHVREIMDEVLGAKNFVSIIAVRKTTGETSGFLSVTCDFLVWYAKNKPVAKFRELFLGRSDDAESRYNQRDRVAEDSLYRLDDVTSARSPNEGDLTMFEIDGVEYSSGKRTFRTDRNGMVRISKARRLIGNGSTLAYKHFLDDFPAAPISNLWTDISGAVQSRSDPKVYVVQTGTPIVERCLLMTTDPSDLVLDPTCGSGTLAYVAEKLGRRWITCDTSRVAVTLAKQRLMTASFDYYELRYPHEGLKGAFIYKTVPHVTLRSIANNPEIDEIYERMHLSIDAALAELNVALKNHPPVDFFTVTEGIRKGTNLTFAAREKLKEWEVPFDWPDGWPEAVRKPFDAFHAARQAMQKQMNSSITAHADSEVLYEQPEKSQTKMRITGPFTVEAVPFPTVLSLNETEQPLEASVAIARSGESSRQHSWRDELLKTGIRGKGSQMLKFAGMETLPSTVCLHALGTLDSGERVVVSFGPEHGALEQRQVEHALREAGELFPLPKMVVFCAFEFDPEAAKDIDAVKGITALKAKMNTDLLTDDLKKARSSNQSFWLMGQPDVELRKRKDGKYEVEVNGFDYFDTAKGELVSGGKGKIAMWLLDTDYDDRSLFPRQVFFPMAGKGEGWMKLKKDIRAELDEGQLDKFHGTVSLPFEPGENRKIAVKIVDDRGIESVKVIPLA
jgi:adenine-specific DNA-methyltransferase